jgi:hypothetical protein
MSQVMFDFLDGKYKEIDSILTENDLSQAVIDGYITQEEKDLILNSE